MFVKNHTAEDYPIFCQWWKAWGWPVIPEAFLPPNSLVVCGDDEAPIAAVFLYRTDAPIIWAENYISDRESPDRREAMEVLIDFITPRAKELGALVVMSAVKHNGLARRLENAGFTRGDEKLTNYILAV
jgi:hypothetical protein